MTIVGLDDTDSRERGTCTTYVASLLADALRESGASVERLLLVRLNPAVEHKTRGNGALAVHTDAEPERTLDVAVKTVEPNAELLDPDTNPGIVVAPGGPEAIPEVLAAFARAAVRDHHTIEAAFDLLDVQGYDRTGWGTSRGVIGALAAVGAPRAFSEWTYEHVAYREPDRWGTPRDVDPDSAFGAADRGYPEAWDTVDRGEGELVCVPRTPCPVLFGIRGDDLQTVRAVAAGIESEPVARAETFRTNQGTDVHLRDAALPAVADGSAYRVSGTVASEPETHRGGHVHVDLTDRNAIAGGGRAEDGWTGATRLGCIAFEPTKRFRDRVRALRVGDRLTVCGEVSSGTLKLEKFAVRELARTEAVTPTCPGCERTMESAGREQGYRCRECGTSRDQKAVREVDRDLDPGWYEVPPCARRHVAKPLVRGGFDAPVHPER